MSSLIRTARRALARLTAGSDKVEAPTKKPIPNRQRRKGGRSADSYRAATRAETIKQAKATRHLVRDSAKARSIAVDLPRADGKCRDRECARRLRQLSQRAA